MIDEARMSSSAKAWAAAAAVGLSALFVASPSVAGEPCRVQFTDVQLQPYQSGGRTMYRFRLQGDHNYDPATNTGGVNRTSFDIIDSDGFFVTAVFVARWGGGPAGIAAPRSVRIQNDELKTLIRANRIGHEYYERLREIISTPPQPADYTGGMASIGRKQNLLGEIEMALGEAEDLRAADDTVAMTSLPWLRNEMARFRTDRDRDLASQYRDNRIDNGAPNLMCSPEARSVVIGRLACPPNPAAGAASSRVDAPCRDGLTFSPIVLPRSDL